MVGTSMIKVNRVSVQAAAGQLVKAYQARLQHEQSHGALQGKLLMVTARAPETYEELKEAFDAGNLAVTPENSSTCIYSTVRGNVLFRLHHDLQHIKHRLDFSLAGEIEAARMGWNDLKPELTKARADGLQFLHDVYMADTIGQAVYFAKWGEHVQDQQAFVLQYLQTGNLPKDRV